MKNEENVIIVYYLLELYNNYYFIDNKYDSFL